MWIETKMKQKKIHIAFNLKHNVQTKAVLKWEDK